MLLPWQRVGRVGAPTILWGVLGGSGHSCSEPAAAVPFPPLQVMLSEQTGQAAPLPAPGVAMSPPALPAFPSCILQGVGHGGTVLPVLHGSGVVHCCWQRFPLSAQEISAVPEQEVHSSVSAGPAQGAAQPSWDEAEALKPDYSFNLKGSQRGGTLWVLRAGAVFGSGGAAQSHALRRARGLTRLPPLPQPRLTWPTASTRRSTRAQPSRGTRSSRWRRLLSRPSTWQVRREHGWPIPSV